MRPTHLIAAFVVVFLWGMNFVPMKVAVSEIPPIFLTGLRMAATALILVGFVSPPRGHYRRVMLLSLVMGTTHYGLIYSGIAEVDVAVTAIVIQLGVPFSAILALVMLNDRFGWRRTLGLIVAFGGVVLLAGEPQTASSLPHLLMIVAAAFFWALANVLIKSLSEIPTFTVVCYMALFASPQLFLLSFLLEEAQWGALLGASWAVYASLAYMVVATSVLSYFIWYRLLTLYPVSNVVPITLLAPVIGGISGIIILDELLTWEKIVGGALTIGGVAVIQLRWRKVAAAQN